MGQTYVTLDKKLLSLVFLICDNIHGAVVKLEGDKVQKVPGKQHVLN